MHGVWYLFEANIERVYTYVWVSILNPKKSASRNTMYKMWMRLLGVYNE